MKAAVMLVFYVTCIILCATFAFVFVTQFVPGFYHAAADLVQFVWGHEGVPGRVLLFVIPTFFMCLLYLVFNEK